MIFNFYFYLTGYVAVIISTALIVIFAEIIPQAVCSRHGLAIGAFFAIPVRVLIGFWYILAWPIAKLLDTLLGKHNGTMYGVSGNIKKNIGRESKVKKKKKKKINF